MICIYTYKFPCTIFLSCCIVVKVISSMYADLRFFQICYTYISASWTVGTH